MCVVMIVFLVIFLCRDSSTEYDYKVFVLEKLEFVFLFVFMIFVFLFKCSSTKS